MRWKDRWRIVSLAQIQLLFFLLAMAVASTSPARADAPRLSLPLACEPRKTCFIQNYVDVDPGKGVRDYHCGAASYDGHKGVDFRLLSIEAMKRGVPVLAAMDGRVKAVRDGMNDRLVATPEQRKGIKGRECGNGVVLVHARGWTTQYCHLRKGSVQVKKGQRVLRGQQLALVGLSGLTQFPHLHLSVRHKRKVIDPWTGGKTGRNEACRAGKVVTNSLFGERVVRGFSYRSAQPFLFGFASRPVSSPQLMRHGSAPEFLDRHTSHIFFYGQVLNMRKGDQVRIRLEGPGKKLSERTLKPLPRNKASYLAYSGVERFGALWPAGVYWGTFTLLRDGKPLWRKRHSLILE